MPITAFHSLTATTPEDTNYEIRSQHWNAGHALTLNAVGSEISGAFSNAAGGVTFGLETNGRVTAAAPAGGGGITNINLSAGTTSQNLSAFVFSNSNNVSFGLNGSTVTGSASQSVQPVSFTATGNTQATQNTTATGNAMYFSGGPNITVGMTGNTVYLSGGAGAAGNTGYLSAGTATASLGTMSFADSNGVSFGVNGQTLTATVKTDYLTSQSNQALSAANGSFTFQTASFANSNGVSWSTGTQGIFATVKTDYLTTAMASNRGSDFVQATAAFAGTNASGTIASNGISVSVAAPGGGGGAALSAGTQSVSTGTVNFANSNGITFGMSGSNQITASHNGLTSQSNQALSAANGSFTFQTATFANSNGVSFSTGTQGLYATVKTDYLTTAMASNRGSDFVQATAAFAGTNASGTIASNGISVSVGNYITTAALSDHVHSLDQIESPAADKLFFMNTRQLQFQWGTNLSAFATAVSRQGLLEIDVVGATNFATASSDKVDVLHLHQSANNPYLHMLHLQADGTNATCLHIENAGAVGMEINRPISYDGGTVPMILGTSQSNSVANLNANYLEGRNSSYFAVSDHSHANYLTTAALSNHSHGNPTLNLTNLSGTTNSNSAGLTLSLSAAAQSAQPVAYSAANGSANFSTLSLADSNGVSWSTGTQGLFATVKTDYLTTAAQSNHSHGDPTLNLTNLSGTTASNSAGLTLSLSATKESINYWHNVAQFTTLGTAQGNSLVSVFPLVVPNNLVFGRAIFPLSGNCATQTNTSSASVSMAATLVLYSLTGSTLSFVGSMGSNVIGTSWSSNDTSRVTGLMRVAMNPGGGFTSLSAGRYWAAFHLSSTIGTAGTASTTALGYSVTMGLASNFNAISAAGLARSFGYTTNNTYGLVRGMGLISTNASLSSIALSQITVTGTRGALAPVALTFQLNDGIG